MSQRYNERMHLKSNPLPDTLNSKGARFNLGNSQNNPETQSENEEEIDRDEEAKIENS